MPLSSLSPAPTRDWVPVTSTADVDDAVTKAGSNPYFNSSDKLTRIDIWYIHADGKQMKKVIHKSPSYQVQVYWSEYAKSGTWQKQAARIYNHDGAELMFDRATIGTGEDVTLT